MRVESQMYVLMSELENSKSKWMKIWLYSHILQKQEDQCFVWTHFFWIWISTNKAWKWIALAIISDKLLNFKFT